jgi:cytochrome c oxidase subunit 2
MKRSRAIRTLIYLSLLLTAIFTGAPVFRARAEGPPRVINITAKRFAFTPNLITLKKGETVTLRLTSEDVTHGFFMKALKLDELIVPGQPTEVTLTPQQEGRFTTICDHFCGAGHGNMSMTIVVE